MTVLVHHQPIDTSLALSLHIWRVAWDGNSTWDLTGTPNGGIVDFAFPDVGDPRTVQFKYRALKPNNDSDWEPDDFVRQFAQAPQSEVWTFAQSRRILYRNPFPLAAQFGVGVTLTFHVISKARFRGGRLYAWNPYQKSVPASYFAETARDDATSTSTFAVPLQDWMTAGFHLKLVGTDGQGHEVWEPDASNRVWRPVDGTSLWMKSGQCQLQSTPLALASTTLEVLLPASLAAPPTLTLHDVVECEVFPLSASSSAPYLGSALLQVATYQASIVPQGTYTVTADANESTLIVRPFPANPALLTTPSRFALGASAWLSALPTLATATLSIGARAASSFAAGLSVTAAIGNATPYQSVAAVQTGNGSWTVQLSVAEDTKTRLQLSPVNASEPKPYDWIDTARYFTPAAGVTSFFTSEGVFGVSSRGPTPFLQSPSRPALLQAAFGPEVAGSGAFGADELPHGATLLNGNVHFVVHAPHAAWAELITVLEFSVGPATRKAWPMTLTPDALYWWCALPAANAAAGTRYRFVLNDDLEVLDPAAREVQDRGSFDVAFNDNPDDLLTSWSMVGDVALARGLAHRQPWQTMGWQNLLVYELHARRFTDKNSGALLALDLLVDELKPMTRNAEPGYLGALPVTAFELLPVQEFSSAISWGYDPSFYFAVDGHYGGSAAFARFVNAAHASGRAVILDVVYNHSLGSSLMKIAPDVYRNGDYDGDRMNCGHPMVLEFLRQATLHFVGTFGVDGFRFDDTKTILVNDQGGWDFLSALRSSIRAAASALGQPWPYCVAENDQDGKAFDMANPAWSIMDGEWGIDQSYRIRDASYDSGTPSSDSASGLADAMNQPAFWGRPFYEAMRFGESHDMVSAQDSGNKRIAARPPFGQGLQMAKAFGALTILSNGVPMLFMGQEAGEVASFSFDANSPALNPQKYTGPNAPVANAHVLAWFCSLLGLRNDTAQGLQGDSNYQVVSVGHRTIAFTCGAAQSLFTVVTFGTADQSQDSGWLGLPGGSEYKEIFNSSWPAFATEFEPEHTNGSYDARISSGQLLNLPYIGAIVLQRR
jgi:1,4-alpha-glucan branching enzyme